MRNGIDPFQTLGYEFEHQNDLSTFLSFFDERDQKELGEQYVMFRQGKLSVCPEDGYVFWAKHLFTREYIFVEAKAI